MAPKSISNPQFWRDLANTARAHADRMADRKSKLVLLEITDAYERLAARAEELRNSEKENEALPSCDIHSNRKGAAIYTYTKSSMMAIS